MKIELLITIWDWTLLLNWDLGFVISSDNRTIHSLSVNRKLHESYPSFYAATGNLKLRLFSIWVSGSLDWRSLSEQYSNNKKKMPILPYYCLYT